MNAIGDFLKFVLTDVAAFIVTVQVEAAPLHAPDQPAKVEPAAAAAVSVTDVPLVKLAEQDEVQAMPDGAEVTVPAPDPALV